MKYHLHSRVANLASAKLNVHFLRFASLLLCTSLILLTFAPPIWALDRATQDRLDDSSGYQIHVVYVVPKGSTDLRHDTNGTVSSWIESSQSLLKSQLGRKLSYDTFKGELDVTFMQSNYSVSELCYKTCEALSKLNVELNQQNKTSLSNKTILFLLDYELDSRYCGWAQRPGNLAVAFAAAGSNCFPQQAITITHELVHTYGIGHTCFSVEDLMLGDCTLTRYTNTPNTIDAPRSNYVGSEKLYGIDLLQMPIWSDGSGRASYSVIKQVSNNKYLPKLQDGKVFAVIGQKSNGFGWEWDKDFYPTEYETTCRFISGSLSISGTLDNSSCRFEVPSTLRAGNSFTVTQKWFIGPWQGEASVSGTLVRSDYSSDVCTSSVCYQGGKTRANYSCWDNSVKSLVLQQLKEGKWIDIQNVPASSGTDCTNKNFPNYPESTIDFGQIGAFIYRWSIPRSGFSYFFDTPFAIVVNDKESAEPSQFLLDLAQKQAVELGKAADYAKSVGTKAAFDTVAEQQASLTKTITEQLPLSSKAKQEAEAKAAEELKAKQEAEAKAAEELKAKQEAEAKAAARAALAKKTTITCIKGKTVKKVTATKPKCPSGYKKK